MKKLVSLAGIILALATASFAQTYRIDQDGGAIGTGVTINACSGTITEGNGNYGNNDSYQITLCAPAGQAIQLDFTQWAIETCCDYLTIYDNNTNSGTQLYYGNGADPNPGTIIGSGQCLTLTWTSDGSVTDAGWAAGISCTTPVPPPVCSDCSNPTVINAIPFTQSTTTCGACDNFSNADACGSFYMDGEDYVYSYTPTANEDVYVTLTNTNTWTGVFVLDGCPNAGANCVGSNTNSTGNPSITSVSLSAGTTYYIVISTNPSPNCTTFDIDMGVVVPTCSDGIMNQGETGIDCGGPCGPCPTPTVQDCDGAIPVCQNVYSEVNAYSGTGNYPDEINSLSSCLGSGEKNDVWYTFTVQASGQLCFDITPNTLSDDYDWALYNMTNAACGDIYNDPSLEVSCNFSGTSGVTGANGSAGVQNEPCVNVTAGETYVLNVSQFSVSTDGYTLDFGNSTATIFDNVPPAIQSVDQPIACGSNTMTFHFSENILCSTISDGDFTLTGPGGPYTLSGVTGPNCAAGGTQEDDFTITVSPALTTSGNYQLCLTNAAGSVTDLCGNTAPPGCLNFTINNGIVADAGSDATICAGGTGANLGGSPTAIGGTAPYTYAWTPAGGLNNTTSANPTTTTTTTTTYTVVVTDDLGCQAQDDVTITVTPAPVVAINPAAPSICPGDNVILTASGATTYSWSPTIGLSSSTGATITSTPGSTQTYTVTGSTPGCPNDTEDVTVTVYPQITPNFTVAGDFCQATSSINFTETATGETGAATYTWTFPGGSPATGTGANVNGVSWASAGTYNITLTVTENGCSESITLPITINPQPTVTATGTDPLCNGSTDGIINASSASAGAYSWDSGQNTAGPHNVGAGTYTVTFTDGNNCTATDVVTLTDPAVLAITASATDAQCNGVCDGTVTANNATGGTPGYSYTWTGGLPAGQNNINVCDGNYTVTVTDANNCTATANVTVNEPTALTGSITAQTNVSCNGLGDGSVTIAGANGTPGYQYSINGGITFQASGTFNGLTAGNYTVIVQDANNCQTNVLVTITEPTPLTGSITSQTNVSCNGGNDGSVTVTGANGTAGYQYSIDGGTTYQASGTFGSLTAGNYTITIQDANLCTTTVPVTIVQPTQVTGSITVQTNVSCNGGNDGSVTVAAANGSPGYQYSIDGGTNWQMGGTFGSLSAGNYTVTIEDANNCQNTVAVTITEPLVLTGSITAQTNVSCNGGNDGSVTIAGADGTAGYQYSIDGGATYQASGTFGTLTAGSYTITVQDANLCTTTVPVTITEPLTLTASITAQTDVLCNGNGTGSVTVAGADGTPTYQYSINGGTTYQASGTFGSLTAGVYTITVQDANLCTTTVPVTITEPTALTGSITLQTNVNCNGGNNGSVTVAGADGTPGYQYSIDGGTTYQASGTFGTMTAGNYTITIQDANLCTTTVPVTITEPTALTGSITAQTDVLCNGDNTGEVTITAADGTPGYQYSIDGGTNWQMSGVFSSLTAGAYTITIEDANLCQTTVPVTITEPTALVGSLDGTTDATCGASNGDADVSASGGVGPYQFSIDGGTTFQASGTFGTLAPGSYTIIAEDANGCQVNINATINDLSGITASITAQTDVDCNGNNTGSVTVTASGSVAPYEYSLDGGPFQASGTFSNLTAGVYTVTAEDANNCLFPVTVTITEPTALTTSITLQADVLCNGGNDGSVTVAGADGTPGYQYSIDGGTTYQASGTFGTLTAGSYTITVQDANLCTTTVPVTITEPTALTGSITAQTDVLCNGGTDGTVDVAGANGTPTYQYSIDGGTNWQMTGSFTGLAAGPYTVTIEDANGCQITVPVTINEPVALAGVLNGTIDATCGASNGSITVSATDGTPTYQYSIDGGANFQASGVFGTLAPGAYTIIVEDANGCQDNINATINDLSGITASITAQTDVDCNGNNSGSVTVTASGSVAPYEYSLDGGPFQASGTFNNLTAGVYTVTAEDANNCLFPVTVTITEPTALTASITLQADVLCNGGNDGSVTVAGADGTPGYQYSIDGGTTYQASGTFGTLTAGSYTITVQDANLCTTTVPVTITEPTALIGSITAQTDVFCNGGTDGTVDIAGADGTPTYQYSIDGGTNWQTTGSFTGLAAGPYTVTIEDANGCQTTVPVTINEPVALSVTTSSTDANCGQADGEVCVTVSDGTPGYTYQWDDAALQTTACASNVLAGTYNVNVLDANNCPISATITINDLAGPTAAASLVSDASGAGLCDGEVTVTPTGGTAPFTYLWDDPSAQTTQNATGLCAGTYCVTITDANGCTATSCVTVNEPGAIIVTITPVDILCNAACTGEADVTVSGGIAPYTYSWAHGPTAEDLTGLCAGTYTVTVIDDNGVSSSQSVTINEPTAITVTNITGTDVLCNAACDGTLDVTATGGTGTLVYQWDGGLPAGAAQTNVCAGTYNVTITDDNLCNITDTYTITEPTALALVTSNTDANCGQANGEACVAVSGGTTNYTILWDDPSAQTTLCASNVASGVYNVTVTDANNCVETASVTVNDISGGSVAITVDNNASCNGICDGVATATMTGGAAPFTYLWDSGAAVNSATNTGICAGTVNVTVTDNDGCSTTASATITEPTLLTTVSSATDVSCNGFTDGSVTTTPAGGTAAVAYTYDWIDQSTGTSVGTTQTVNNLGIGTYCVLVTDDNNCTVTECVTISEPTAIAVTTSSVDANCGQSDGSVAVATTSGGSGFYNSEDWVDGLGNPVTIINAVPTGTYTVTVTDNTGCTGTAVATVSDQSGPTVSILSQTDASCNGLCDGTASVDVTGGTAPYTYNWLPAPGSGAGTGTIGGLCAGVYSLNLTDDNGCTTSITVTINEPAPVALSLTSAVDASGAGICDGTADVSAAGGDGNYTYSWFNDCAATSPNGTLNGNSVTGLCANTYAVVVTDGNTCDDTLCITINEPGAISSILTGTDALCNGDCNGSINVAASGGIAPFTYQWYSSPSNTPIGQTAATATNLCAGDYYVVVTDANSVTHTSAFYTINEPQPLISLAAVISNYNGYDVSCQNSCDGIAEATVSGGTAPYSYLWDATAGGQTTPIANNLCALAYDVTVTDANGCTHTSNVVLSKPPVLANVFSATDVSCNSACDGTITATPAGGAGNYTYQWNDPALSTTATVNNLCAGSYDVTITDANGCTITETQAITEPIALVLSSSMTGSNCNQNDGSASVSVVSGVPPYTYQWDAAAGNQTTATASNLFAGCYDVTVTDGNGCTETINVCVIDLGAPTANILTQTDVSCNAGCDGFAQIQIIGGTPPLNYNWYDIGGTPIGQTTASATGLCAGTYTGEMIDAVGCQATVNVIVAEPTALNGVITASTDVTCFGDCDGTATVTASGATGPYTYQWNDPAGQTTATASNLCPGSYTVTITDAMGCTFNVNATIGEPVQMLISATSVDAFCNTASGSANVSVNVRGVAPISFLWDDPSNQSTANAINLLPGTYNVVATDLDGCTATTSATVGDIPAGTATIATSTDVSCNGLSDGTATVSMSGTGTAPYSYEWFNASNISIGMNSTTATGLSAGDYYVVVTDINGCVSTSGTVTINQPNQLTLSTTTALASCSGVCDGQAQGFPVGGTAPYNYLWDDPLAQNTQLANTLCAGTYNLTVTDDNGCTVSESATVGEPTSLVLDSTVTNANCGLSDGSACVLVTGGTGPYTYLWPDGSTNSCHIGLAAATYLVTVTDANGCSQQIAVQVSDLSGPSAGIIGQTNTSCYGICDGSATVDMIGGQGTTFTVQWDGNANNQTTPTASNLCAGIYTVTITDDLGCNASISATITQPDSLDNNPTTLDPTCFGYNDGQASVVIVGGTPGYTYDWVDVSGNSIGQNTATATGLSSGDYSVIVQDQNGCTEIVDYTLTDPAQAVVSTSGNNISCFNACDGSATATALVGVSPFTYQWDAATGSQIGSSAYNLCPGTYTVTMTDDDGCIATENITITEPPLLQAAINISGNVSCAGFNDGFAQVDVIGGTPGYNYQWDNGGGILPTATSLVANTYNVTVTDANLCTATATVTITEPTPLALSSTTTNVDCYGNCNGTATLNVSGGAGGLTYLWNDPAFSTTPNVSGLCSGTYTAVVTDANGCTISETVNITQPTQINMSINVTNSNCGQNNGQICANIFGGSTPYVYQWNDPNTQTTACAQNLFANCYTLTVTDANGCISDSLICINDIAGPTVVLDAITDVTCNGDQNGAVSFNISGGTGASTLTWVDDLGNNLPAGNGANSLSNLDGGCYTIQAVDAANCFASLTACVVEPPQINSAIFNSNDVQCNTGCDGDATVMANGGLVAGDYSYNWNDPASQTTAMAIGLCAGTYTVTVTDDNNCSTQSSAVIGEPTPISITLANSTDASCFGFCDGSATMNISGGTAPYLYNWDPQGGSANTANNLCAGNYTFKVTDANGCVDSLVVTINEPQALGATFTTVNSTCTQCNGEATVNVTGGTSGYTYNWFGLGTTPNGQNNIGLCPGNVSVEITDANGCVYNSFTTIIDEPSPVIDSITFIEPTCFNSNTGSATVYASGGTTGLAGYQYQWNDPAGQLAQTAVALPDGVYCVQVTDDNGCSVSNCVNVTEPADLIAVPDIPRTICFGDSTQIWASGQGGTAPYVIHWADPSLVGPGPLMVSPNLNHRLLLYGK